MEARITKARARGQALGFTGMFLSNFIERELKLMQKWAAARMSNSLEESAALCARSMQTEAARE
jgi:hypothetical protein